MSFLISLFRNRRREEPYIGIIEEIRAPQSAKVIRDPRVKYPIELTDEEKKKEFPFKITIHDFRTASLDAVPTPTLFEAPLFRQEQEKYSLKNPPRTYAIVDRPCWAYRFNFSEWMNEYNIAELFVTDLGQFAINSMMFDDIYEPSTEEELLQHRNFLEVGQLNPPEDTIYVKDIHSIGSARDKERERFRRLINTMGRTPMKQYLTLTREARNAAKIASGGRLELLASIYRQLGIETLILFDNIGDYDRQTTLIFYFIDILGATVKNLHLDRIKGETPIDLAENIDFRYLDTLTITESSFDSAWHTNFVPAVLKKWLVTRHEDKQNISFLFCKCFCFPLSIKIFIEDWNEMRNPQVFHQIVFDSGTFKVNELIECLADKWFCYTNPKINPLYFRELDAYVIHQRRCQFVFPHAYCEALIHYKFREGQFVLTYYPNETIMLQRILSARDWRHFIEAGSAFRWSAPSPPRDMIIMRHKKRINEKITGLLRMLYESAGVPCG